MNPRICICCGEPMAEVHNPLSRNPNLCASCSSMLDGMDETTPPVAPPEIPAVSKQSAPKEAPKESDTINRIVP